jgi:hypothetical protein
MPEEKGSNKVLFLTDNFILEHMKKASEKEAILNWKLKHIDGDKNNIVYDIKSRVYCANPTMDFNCYYNYMVLLNQTYDYWKNYGLFDQGFKPLIYMPSFWRSQAVPDTLMQMATIAGVNLERGPSVSLMGVNRTAGYSDYWVYKDQLTKLIDFAEQQFYEKFKIEPKGKFDFGTREPDKVRPTQLIKVYANLERELNKG